ncbi:methyltransferase domain-containing protein [Lysobacter silvisoli]|uniref:Methyltransferase domain-containing protein n=1 Tax=Lysobacter silvisoli TaxID=2293254 RepID=A0A371JZC1_9GAMM|nr:methyltransferase domain-containing protein [Lysobacter silvisoli]RDZ27025.1 methyltransferase domain-containing protein [Lysobacter silvisoli]
MQPLSYTALERVKVPRPRDRLSQIEAHAHGKRVFDLGALDETAYGAKQDKGLWLHSRLCAVAREVIGIDNSALVPQGGLATRPNGRIVQADIFALGDSVARYGQPDLIVAGELIEHLPDTLGFLRSLKACPELQGVEFVFSTPNACSWHNIAIGLAGRESTHPDHLQIYSYKTLRTLFDRAGIELHSLSPYGARFDEMIERSGAAGRLAVRGFQAGVNLLEWATPMLSAGWVGVARI